MAGAVLRPRCSGGGSRRRRPSLGLIPKPDAVNLLITLSAELKAQLDAHAQVHAQVHRASADVVSLIPQMLAASMGRGRGFRRALLSKGREVLKCMKLQLNIRYAKHGLTY